MKIAKVDSAKLSVRADPYSGHLTKKVKGSLPAGVGQCIILVHGFNVNERSAKKNYESLSNNLSGGSVFGHTPGQLCEFFWPGNESGALESAFSYSRQISKARDSGVLLGDYLRQYLQKSPGTQFVLVCHSLGCRLVLEALRSITTVNPNAALHIRLIIMMAAAVPFHFINAGHFNVPLYSKKTACLYSQQDSILRYLFPIGQSMAGDGFYPTAIGLNGSPLPLWTGGHLETGLSHKDYWGSKQVATRVRAILGMATARTISTRMISVRQLATSLI